LSHSFLERYLTSEYNTQYTISNPFLKITYIDESAGLCHFPAIYIYDSVHFSVFNIKKFIIKHKIIKIHEIN